MVKKLNSKKKPVVLVVEDVPIAQLVMKSLLDQLGCEAELATTGEDALFLVNKNYSHYKLIFMDIGLPGMNGLQLARIIRKNEKSKEHIPIVAVTGHVEEEKDCYDAGMDGFINKPAGQEQIKSILIQYQLISG